MTYLKIKCDQCNGDKINYIPGAIQGVVLVFTCPACGGKGYQVLKFKKVGEE